MRTWPTRLNWSREVELQRGNDLADGVVGHAAVEGLDDVGPRWRDDLDLIDTHPPAGVGRYSLWQADGWAVVAKVSGIATSESMADNGCGCPATNRERAQRSPQRRGLRHRQQMKGNESAPVCAGRHDPNLSWGFPPATIGGTVSVDLRSRDLHDTRSASPPPRLNIN